MASMPQYGYLQNTYRPPKPKPISLSQAAGTKTNDVFGLNNDSAGPAPVPPAQIKASLAANPQASYGAYGMTGPGNTGVASNMAPQVDTLTALQGMQGPPTAGAVNKYDPNTDPAFQAINAQLGLSDDQAKAMAQQQIRDQILAYGDPNLANSVLHDSSLAQAAAQNPTSTVAQLNQQKTRNLKSLDDALNSQNLSYSGYRVTQEQQAAQDFQNALAQAAAQVNGNLGQINQGLAGALNANQQQRLAALFQAEMLAAQNPAPVPDGPSAGGSGDTGDSGGGGTINSGVGASPAAGYASADPTLLLNLARAAANRGLQVF